MSYPKHTILLSFLNAVLKRICAVQRGREQQNIEVARKMLLVGMNIEMRSGSTELSVEEIQGIKIENV